MNKVLIFLMIFIVSCSSSLTKKKYPRKLRKGESFFGNQKTRSGAGVLKYKDFLYLGNFKKLKKEGWFKIIFPNGDYAFSYFIDDYSNYSKTKKKTIYVTKDKIFISNFFSTYSSIVVGYSLDPNDKRTFFGTISLAQKKDKNTIFNGLVKNLNDFTTKYYKDQINYYLNEGGYQIKKTNYDYDSKYFIGEYTDLHNIKIKTLFKKYTESTKNDYFEIIESKEKDFIQIIKWIAIKNGEVYTYEGSSKNKVPNGFGKLSTGKKIFWGYFKNGKLHGTVIEKRLNEKNAVWYGNYKDGKRDGVFIYAGRANDFDYKVNVNFEGIKKINKKYTTLETWFKNQKKGELPSSIDQTDNILNYINNGFVNRFVINDKYDKVKYGLGNRQISLGQDSNLYHDLLGLDYYFLRKNNQMSKYGDKKIVFFERYENDELKKKSNFKFNTLSCKIYSNVGMFLMDNCTNPKFGLNYSDSKIIQYPKLKNKKIIAGRINNFHFFNKANGFDGFIENGRKEGFGIKKGSNKSEKYIGDYYSDQYHGQGLISKNGKTWIGHFNQGKKEGKFTIFDGAYKNRGKYQNDLKQGKYSIFNPYFNIKGKTYYKSDRENGTRILRYIKDKKIFFKLNYIMDLANGKGVCYSEDIKKVENCEYKIGKRIDQVFISRETERKLKKKEYERKRRLEKERSLAEQRRKEREWAIEREQKRKEKKRAEARRRQQWQNFNRQMIQKFSQPRNNYNSYQYQTPKNYLPKTKSKKKYSKKSNKYNTKPINKSSGSTLTLKATKPYKECLITEYVENQKIEATYDCNRREKTYPKALEKIKSQRDWWFAEFKKRREAKERQERMIRENNERRNQACEKDYARVKTYCISSCASSKKYKDRTKSCRAILK